MSIDAQTLAFYQANAGDDAGRFSRDTPDIDLAAFIGDVPAGGRVLDLGCGPGNSAAIMQGHGLVVEASDASLSMAEIAREKYGIAVRVEPFEGLNAVARYNGIWANFSLLHGARGEMSANLARIHRALKPAGRLHLGMKLGQGTARDRLGRQYTYYSAPELTGLVEAAGFSGVATRLGEGPGLAGAVEPFVILAARA